jgi:hypothetical protein
MTATELGYFRNIIKYCRSNISLTGDPACVAANKRAIDVLEKAYKLSVGSRP